MNKPKVGVIGGNGLLGRALVKHFHAVNITNLGWNDTTYYDLLINANGNASKHWAMLNPREDWRKSVTSVYSSIQNFRFKRYLYISTVDVGKGVYGFHKGIAEQVVRHFCPTYYIVRCSALVGEGLRKGPVYDMCKGSDMYVTRESRIQFISTKAIGHIIVGLMTSGLRNIEMTACPIGTTSMYDLETITGEKPNYGNDHQEYTHDSTFARELYPALQTSNHYVREVLNERMD